MSCARLLQGLIVAACVSLLAAGSASAATFRVLSTEDAVDARVGDGICATAAGACTLRAAVQEANVYVTDTSMDNILLAPGTYRLTIAGAGEDSAATGDLDIQNSMSIGGAGAGRTIIDGGGLDRVFDIFSLADTPPHEFEAIFADIRYVTITNGAAPHGENGGGIRDHGNLWLFYSELRSNAAPGGRGGGIFATSPHIYSSDVLDNTAAQGGGIYINSSIIFGAGTVGGNRATGHGGGIYSGGGNGMIVYAAAITGNTAGGSGGGLFSETGNSTSSGAKLDNTTISGNVAARGAGIAATQWSWLRLTFATIADNRLTAGQPPAEGAGLHNTGLADLSATIFAANGGDNCAGTVLPDSYGGNVEDGATCQLRHAGDRAQADPKLAPLGSNGGRSATHPLSPDSPAINLLNGCVSGRWFDQRDVERPGGACDSGAYEYTTEPVPNRPMPIPAPQDWWPTTEATAPAPDPAPAPSAPAPSAPAPALAPEQEITNDQTSALGSTPGTGDDVVRGTAANDVLYGYSGDDRLYGLSGSDRLYGGAGNDQLFGGRGSDLLFGGDGTDRLSGSYGHDRMYGGAGADHLVGGPGRDQLSGSSGNDTLAGGAHDDRLVGGAGRDRLAGGTGRDVLEGGGGNDAIDARDRQRDVIRCGAGRDTVRADRGDVVARDCEIVRRA